MRSPEVRTSGADPVSRALRITAVAATASLLVCQVFAVFSRFLVNDDYQTLYTAWLRAKGKVPGRDFFLASYYLLPDLLALFFRMDLGTWVPLYAGRILLVGTMGIVAILLNRLGTRLFSPTTGLLAPILALSSAAMIYRGLDLRPDLITTASWLAVFTLLASPSLSNRKAGAVGLLLGFSLLNRFKAALIAPFLLIEYLSRTRRRNLWPPILFTALGAVFVFVLYLVWIAATDGLRTFLDVNRQLFAGMEGFQVLGVGARGRTFRGTLGLDALYWALVGLGVILRVGHHREYDRDQNRLCGLLLGLAAVSVILNPVYYSYNLVTLQVLLAPFGGFALARLIDVCRRALVPILLTLLPVFFQVPSLMQSLDPSNEHQKNLQTFLLRYTRPTAHVFAMEGIGLYRPSTFHWRMPWIYVERYRRGDWRFADELRRNPPEIVVRSYRVPGWMTESDRDFLAKHYQWLTDQILVPGCDTGRRDGEYRADFLIGGDYEGLRDGDGICLADERPFTTGERLTLTAGTHRLTARGARCALRRHYPADARALLRNPDRLPYLSVVYLGPIPRAIPIPPDAAPWPLAESP
jgi:hypothetical protein